MNNAQINQGDEIDLLELLLKLWKGRKTILYSFLICFLLGLMVALFSPKEYTATCVVVPSNKQSAMASLGGLAALAGINISSGSDDNIVPKLYPTLAKTIPFQREMLKTPINIEGVAGPITYADYYKNHAKPSVLGLIKKYTIGLPGVIFGEGKSEESQGSLQEKAEEGILAVSKEEKKLLKQIGKQFLVNYSEKDNVIKLSYSMPEALAAAQMLENAQRYLQNAVTKLKLEKSQGELEFIEKRYNEAKEHYKAKQVSLAAFQDANRGLMSSLSQTQQSRLEFDFNMAYSVYNELSKQLEMQKIKVKEETPVFTIIEPVSVPVDKSKPNRFIIMVVWSVLGLALGVGLVLARYFLQSFKKNKE